MTKQQYIISRKVNMLELGRTLGNVSEPCRKLRVFRQHCYYVKRAIAGTDLRSSWRRVVELHELVTGWGWRRRYWVTRLSILRTGRCAFLMSSRGVGYDGDVWSENGMAEAQSLDEEVSAQAVGGVGCGERGFCEAVFGEDGAECCGFFE